MKATAPPSFDKLRTAPGHGQRAGGGAKKIVDQTHMAQDPILLIVRRGAIRRFATLQRKTSHLDVKVIWDRRVETRRHGPRDIRDDQRASERRTNRPSSWELADFAVSVPTTQDECQPRS